MILSLTKFVNVHKTDHCIKFDDASVQWMATKERIHSYIYVFLVPPLILDFESS